MISIRAAIDQVAALLATIPDAKMHGYPEGEIPQDDPPPTVPNSDRVKAYWVLYAGPGAAETPHLDAEPFIRSLNFTVTVAAGTPNQAMWGIETVRATINGAVIGSGLITEQPYDPGQVRSDNAVVPPRHYVPLQFRLEP